jgi:hypothetical protein
MVNQLAERRTSGRMPGMPREAVSACSNFRGYCELGVVSPDYPYLKILSGASSEWADRFHHDTTDAVIRNAIAILRTWDGDKQAKGLAWLLGYLTHLVMDVTMHPVVNKKVGPYEQNKSEHRRCEMSQDVYIFDKLMNLDVKLSEFLNSGILRCGPNASTLDPDIIELWTTSIQRAYPDAFQADAPDPASWHQWFGTMVDKVAEEGDWLVSISRHVFDGGVALTFPALDEIDRDFIDNLHQPDGEPIKFDDLFDKAKNNCAELWPLVAKAVFENDDAFDTALGDWNMDTGEDKNGRMVFWS